MTLKTAICGILLIGCTAHSYYVDKETKVRYYYAETIEKGAFEVNSSNILKRYCCVPREEREKELVVLAKTASEEEMFAYVLPDEIWYEIGYKSNACNAYGVSLEWLVRHSGTKNIESISIYHIHPKETERPQPPSFTDFLNSYNTRKRLNNIVLEEFVADPFGIWEYGVTKIDEDKFDSFMEAVIKANIEWIRHNISPEEYISRFYKIFEENGLGKDVLILDYKRYK